MSPTSDDPHTNGQAAELPLLTHEARRMPRETMPAAERAHTGDTV